MKFLHGQEMAYFDARSKGLVQINNSKHFPIDQYLHDKMTLATLSPSPLVYEKLIHPTEMPCIATCTEHLKLKDETPFFVRPYPMREEQKKVIQKEIDRLEHLGIIWKGLTSYSSPVVLVKQKNQNLYRVCSDFRILNEKLVKINHAFPLVRDCIEQLGRKKCHYLSTIDLRDAFHTLRLALSSQKYCGITPYYGSPTYHYLHMGMGMSVSP